MAAIAVAARRSRSSNRQPKLDDDDDVVDLEVKPLPPIEERIRSAVVDKRVQTNDGHQWHERFIVLTEECLLFARDEDENKVIDLIPLAEIDKVDAARPQEGTKRRLSVSSEMPVAEEEEVTFNVMTNEEGHNSGRTYTLKTRAPASLDLDTQRSIAAAREECDAWVAAIRHGMLEEKKRVKLLSQGTPLDQLRRKVKILYEGNVVQGFIAIVIFGSFALNLVNAEILPEDEATIQVFERLDLAFTIIFTVELCANFFANYWYPFWREAWNLFDTFVVAISLLSLAMEELPAVNMLRLIRIFRVIRLFRALRSLRQIINALIASIFPVISSFLVLLLITCIYAVLGTMFFNVRDEEHFSKFSQSLFTMFQVCTGDSWASVVARGNFRDAGDGWDHAIKFFFLSYILIANMVLVNIVVAVLLDNFITSVSNEKEEEKKRQRELELKKRPRVTGVLDPVLFNLSQFSGPQDLSKRVSALYKFLDIDDNGGLSFEELREGLRKFPSFPHIKLTEEDFDAITENRTLCNHEGEMDPNTFEVMMLRQMQSYALRQLSNTMLELSAQTHDKIPHVQLFIFKMLSLSVDGFFQQRLSNYDAQRQQTGFSPLPHLAHNALLGRSPPLPLPAQSLRQLLPVASPGQSFNLKDGSTVTAGAPGSGSFEKVQDGNGGEMHGSVGTAAAHTGRNLNQARTDGDGGKPGPRTVGEVLRAAEEAKREHCDAAATATTQLGNGEGAGAAVAMDGAVAARFLRIEDKLEQLDAKMERILGLLGDGRGTPASSHRSALGFEQYRPPSRAGSSRRRESADMDRMVLVQSRRRNGPAPGSRSMELRAVEVSDERQQPAGRSHFEDQRRGAGGGGAREEGRGEEAAEAEAEAELAERLAQEEAGHRADPDGRAAAPLTMEGLQDDRAAASEHSTPLGDAHPAATAGWSSAWSGDHARLDKGGKGRKAVPYGAHAHAPGDDSETRPMVRYTLPRRRAAHASSDSRDNPAHPSQSTSPPGAGASASQSTRSKYLRRGGPLEVHHGRAGGEEH